MDLSALQPGDWIRIDYGFGRLRFCLLGREGDYLVLAHPGWLASHELVINGAEVAAKDPVFIGRGRARWWRKFLPGMRDLICPYSSPTKY
jgi:hypothetical protein